MNTTPRSAHELRVGAAVEAVYAAFSDVPKPSIVRGCPCCSSGVDLCRLTNRSLRELTGDDLDRYAWKAVSTVGTADDLSYFFPRLLELLAVGSLEVETEVVLAKLSCVYDAWPAPMRRAVDELVEAVIVRELIRSSGEPDGWIGGYALGAIDAAARLAPVLDDAAAATGLATWFARNLDAFGGVALRNAYLSAEDAGARVLDAWMHRADVRRRLGLEGGTQGVLAEENCLFDCVVDARGRVLLNVEFEVHPGGSSSLRIELSLAEKRRRLTHAALRELAFEIGGSPDRWFARRI